MGNLEDMTDRQRNAWPQAVKEINRYGVWSPEDPNHHDWLFTWQEETRPGRGQAFSALFIDSDYYAQVMMDVYGYPTVTVASLDILHCSSDEECICEFCTADREVENAAFGQDGDLFIQTPLPDDPAVQVKRLPLWKRAWLRLRDGMTR